jgi:hypothetical protein
LHDIVQEINQTEDIQVIVPSESSYDVGEWQYNAMMDSMRKIAASERYKSQHYVGVVPGQTLLIFGSLSFEAPNFGFSTKAGHAEKGTRRLCIEQLIRIWQFHHNKRFENHITAVLDFLALATEPVLVGKDKFGGKHPKAARDALGKVVDTIRTTGFRTQSPDTGW